MRSLWLLWFLLVRINFVSFYLFIIITALVCLECCSQPEHRCEISEKTLREYSLNYLIFLVTNKLLLMTRGKERAFTVSNGARVRGLRTFNKKFSRWLFCPLRCEGTWKSAGGVRQCSRKIERYIWYLKISKMALIV